ncbi:ATP-binding protein [Kitasatospora aureofaciens]|uniref:ATP-binding protein n=1 Tax=Kitasatospora aureofaciens TaxID=1894 RepID=UPI0033C6579C
MKVLPHALTVALLSPAALPLRRRPKQIFRFLASGNSGFFPVLHGADGRSLGVGRHDQRHPERVKAPPMEPRPRTTKFTFSAERERIRDVRCWARETLAGLGLDADEEPATDVLLVLSELCGNAIVHGCGDNRPDVTLTAGLSLLPGGGLRVDVTDPSSELPELRDVDGNATSGRGLTLVITYADRFGVDDLGPHGKCVWAEVDLSAALQAAALADAAAVCGGPDVAVVVAALRADTAVRAMRPQPAVGMLPARPILRRQISAA